MYIKNKLLALEYRIILIVCGFIGILGTFIGAGNSFIINYYTVFSNILVLLFFIVTVYFNHADIIKNGVFGCAVFLPRIKGALMLMIIMTCLFYHFILPPEEGAVGLDSIIVHYIIPFLCILDWLIFDKKRDFKYYDPFLWIIAPFAYICYIFVRAKMSKPFPTGRRFPYFFLDTDVLKGSAVVFYIAVLGGLFILIGELLYVLDRFLPLLAVPKEKERA